MRLYRIRTAWLALVVALALHVADEALTGFLDVYNPTVRALRERLAWFPMPEFQFEVWATGLAAFVAGLALLTPLVERGPRVVRAAAVVFAGLMVLNGAAHIARAPWPAERCPPCDSSVRCRGSGPRPS